MNHRVSLPQANLRAMTLPEVMVAAAILSLVMASLVVGVSTLQRTFRASQHHSKSQIEQARLLDYVARDLRRALEVSVDTFEGSSRINIQIPDYYDEKDTPNDSSDDVPRQARIVGRNIEYGSAPVLVTYYKSGSTIFRDYRGRITSIVSDVSDFNMQYTDAGNQSVQVSVTFIPRYHFSGLSEQDARASTRATMNILLRNKRRAVEAAQTNSFRLTQQ
jgi:prepilin-type N-terminal cleavage/methylation domain-containing protein